MALAMCLRIISCGHAAKETVVRPLQDQEDVVLLPPVGWSWSWEVAALTQIIEEAGLKWIAK